MNESHLHLIGQRVEKARVDSPSGDELEGAPAGEPVLVYDPEGDPAYWLVPFLRDDMAAGFATVTLAGAVQRIGTFGGGRADRAAWIPALYFERPPDVVIAEIRACYPDSSMSAPLFSYDRSPSRWAWRIQVDPPDGDLVFIAPGGWYSRPACERREQDRE